MSKQAIWCAFCVSLATLLVSLLCARTACAVEDSETLWKLADGVQMFVPLDGAQVLCYGGDESSPGFFSINLSLGGSAGWQSDWDPQSGGWDMSLDGVGMINGLAASPDGKLVAYSQRVGVIPPGAEDTYPWTADLVILCKPDGSNARAVALSEIRDGSTQMIFSQDGSRLFDIMYIPCEPTAEGYREFVSSVDTDSEFPLTLFNYVDTASGTQGNVEGLFDAELIEPCPFSDNFAYYELDSDKLFFGNLFDGPLGSCEALGSGQYFDWVLPDTVMLSFGGSQALASAGGKVSAVPGSFWRCFCTFADGTCMFSDNGGRSISYGKVDWTSQTVDWRVNRSDLAPFAEPTDSEGWPSMINDWHPLPGAMAFLLCEPSELSLYLVTISRDGADVER